MSSLRASVAVALGPLVLDLGSSDEDLLAAVVSAYGGYVRAPGGQAILRFSDEEVWPASWPDERAEGAPLGGPVRAFAGRPGMPSGQIALIRGDFRALVDVPGATGRAVVLSGGRLTADAIIRITASLLLPARGGLLVHGASFDLNGRGILAMGPSGSGKSTLARLSGCPVLSDEISLVTIGPAGEVQVQGTPFAGGPAPAPRQALPLERLLVLSQDRDASLEPIPPEKQPAAFLRNVIHYAPDADGFDRAAGLVLRILAVRPLERLRFAASSSFLEVL